MSNKIEKKIDKIWNVNSGKWAVAGFVILGLGVVSGTALGLSITNSVRAEIARGDYDGINDSLNLLSKAYDDQAETIEVNEKNISELSKTVSENVESLMMSIRESEDELTKAYSSDIEARVQEMWDAWNVSDEEEDPITSDDIDQIYNSISLLQNDIRSIDKQQTSITEVIELAKNDVDSTLTDLWSSISSLNDVVGGLSSGVDVNETNIEKISDELDTIQVKILEIDKLKQKVANIEAEATGVYNQLQNVIANVDDNSYDMEVLTEKLVAVDSSITLMNVTLEELRSLITDAYSKLTRMEAIIDELEEEVAIIGDASAINQAEIDHLKLDISDLFASKDEYDEKFHDVITDLDKMKTSLDDVMTGNAKLATDIDALHTKNDQIMYSLILLQDAVLNLETDFSNKSTVVNITNTYDILVEDKKTYPNIHVDQLSKAKHITLFLKIENKDSGATYYTDVVSAYPKIGASFLGASTTMGKEQHLLNIRVDEDKIAVIGTWYRRNANSSWRDVTSDKDRNIYIEGVTVTY